MVFQSTIPRFDIENNLYNDPPVEDMDIDNQQQISEITDLVLNARNNEIDLQDESQNSSSLNYNNIISNNSAIDSTNNSNKYIYLVVDTNFIISHLHILDELQKIHHNYNDTYKIVIPRQVIHELDGLKESNLSSDMRITSRYSISKLSRTAIDWCYLHFHNCDPIVRGQRLNEMIDKNTTKDNSILDCCLYLKNVENGGFNMVVLLSNDKNLCVKALINEILTVSYRNGMNAKLIADRVVSENVMGTSGKKNLIADYNEPPLDAYHDEDDEDDDDIMDIENEDITRENKEIAESIKLEKKSLDEVCITIYSQVTTLVLEAINYAVNEVFGDDKELIGYEENKIKNLVDACHYIMKLGISTFSEFFQKSYRFNPMNILKDRLQFKKFSQLPEELSDLLEFREFWSNFLTKIYQNRDTSQKEALESILVHWETLIKNR